MDLSTFSAPRQQPPPPPTPAASLQSHGPVSVPAAPSSPPCPLQHHDHPKTTPPEKDADTGQVSQDAFPRASGPSSSRPPLPAAAQLAPLTEAHLPSFRRLISLLLPVRYPDRFYSTLLEDPDGSSISRAVLWSTNTTSSSKKARAGAGAGAAASPVMVIGGIAARMELVMDSVESPDPTPTGAKELYIQTLAVLSPYRGQGLASALLEEAVSEALSRFDGLTSVYAHVWEANDEALEWYRRRGFAVEALRAGYYRRLKPGGARVVRRRIRVGDVLKGLGGR